MSNELNRMHPINWNTLMKTPPCLVYCYVYKHNLLNNEIQDNGESIVLRILMGSDTVPSQFETVSMQN